MKQQKIGRIIVINFFAFAPLACFAAVDQYENPLGCGITSLPQFIKGILTIIVKVGIPVATIFIIWSGFLFLTAQGDETKLTKAKHSFVWACIGTAVLLGAWTLSIAIEGTINDISGGAGKVVSGGGGGPCGGSGGPPLPTSGLSLSCSNAVMAKTLGASPVPLDSDTMGRYGLDSGDPDLLQKAFKITMKEAQTNPNEQAFVFVQYRGGGAAFFQTSNGASTEVKPVPISTIQKAIIDTSILPIDSIRMIHTHPKATLGGNISAPPSFGDLSSDRIYSKTLGAPIISNVADPNGVWEYSTPPLSQMGRFFDLQDKYWALPELKAYADSSPEPCGSPVFMKGVGAVSLSPSSQAVADKLSILQQNTYERLAAQDDALWGIIGKPSHAAEIDKILKDRMRTERDIGVSLKRVF